MAATNLRELRLNFAASCVCGSSAVALFNPLDCLRVRWQTLPAEGVRGTSLAGFGARIVAEEGLWRGLWAPGLFANSLGIGCSTGLRLGLYPTVRDAMGEAFGAGGKTSGAMFAAGLFSGSLGYFISTPLHLVKTRQQAEVALLDAEGTLLARGPRAGHPALFARRSPGGVVTSLRAIVGEESAAGLWRGSMALAARGAFISAGQFWGYDMCKTVCKERGLLLDGPALHTAAGVAAALSAATLAAPSDMLMTRYATAHAVRPSGPYRSYVHCAVELTQQEGAGVWARGWWPMFVRMAPTFVLAMPLYEQLRRLLGLAYLD
eukprot:g7864.t1